MGGGEVKVATVDVEGGDNMATLPVSRSHTTASTDSAEKNNAANKEMELKNVMPQPLQRFDTFHSSFYFISFTLSSPGFIDFSIWCLGG